MTNADKRRRGITPCAEIDDFGFELTGHRGELPACNQFALERNKRREKEQNNAAQRRRLVHQRRLLPRQIDDLRRIHIKAPWHAEQKLDFEATEDADYTEQENNDDHRRHGRYRDPP